MNRPCMTHGAIEITRVSNGVLVRPAHPFDDKGSLLPSSEVLVFEDLERFKQFVADWWDTTGAVK